MTLSQTIQKDFNKMFRLHDIEYPYSLTDMLQMHTHSSNHEDMYMYIYSALQVSFMKSRIYMSPIETHSDTFEYNIADIYIINKKKSEYSIDKKISKQVEDANTNSIFGILGETDKYLIVYRKKSAYDIFKTKVIDHSNRETSTTHIIFKIIVEGTLVCVLYDIEKKHIDIMYSSTIKGKTIDNTRKFQRRLLHNLKKIFGNISFNLYLFDSSITCIQDTLQSYMWFTLTLKFFSPTIDIGKLKEYIFSLTPAHRHNMVIHWANFMIKYAKHLTNVEMDTFLISELVHAKTKKKLTKQSPTKKLKEIETSVASQQGGGQNTIINNSNNNKKKITSHIRQLFTIV